MSLAFRTGSDANALDIGLLGRRATVTLLKSMACR